MSDLYLGLDLSTQQLKGILVNDKLQPVCHAKVEFDHDLPHYKTKKGVYTNEELNEVQAPVAMWLEAVDLLFQRLCKDDKADLKRVKGVSGACQQHGSVFWNNKAEVNLNELDASESLKDQLGGCFAWDKSPNWQDHSTADECQNFENAVGGKEELARISGSKAHHRFTGPQILKLKNKRPDLYEATDRIALVSSFLASVMAGKHASLDIGDVCGMNLWDLQEKKWHQSLLDLIGDDKIADKLGDIAPNGNSSVGTVSSYFVTKYGLNPGCEVLPFTGDNPGTILSLPLETDDVIVSLGTSTTALVVTQKYVPSSLYHMFSHPVGKGYMGMLCYCNGALAREQVRNSINDKYATSGWDKFDQLAMEKPLFGGSSGRKIGFYFPLSEIIPDTSSCIKRLLWSRDAAASPVLDPPHEAWEQPEDDALGILESQALSIRYRLAPMLGSSGKPRRVYFVGGGSANTAICQAFSRVLVPQDSAYTLDLTDACAIGAANKAAFGVITRESGQSWEEFINERWDSNRCAEVSGVRGLQDDYGQEAIDLFVKSEEYLP